MNEIVDFESHMQKREIQDAKNAHELALAHEKTLQAKYNNRADNLENFWIVVGCLIGAVAIVAVCFIIWKGNAGPSAEQQLEDKWRSECLAKQGTYIPSENSSGDPTPICAIGDSKIITPGS